jgi:predicted molibdopterin-dependent oxidoreductase YjgC
MKLVLNGKEIEVEGRPTILQIARENGVKIPNLCDHERLSPFSGCRLCLVEIEGRRGFPPSCGTYAEEGMKIQTDTPQLKKLRQQILELILSEHPSSCLICSEKKDCDDHKSTIRKVGETTGCVLCPNNGRCELQDIVEALEIENVQFPALYRDFEVKKKDPFFDRNYNLCILCGRCVRMCHEVRGASAISFVYRGSDEVIGTVFDKTLVEAGCQFCGACVDICPTGALTERALKYETLPDGQSKTICPLCGIGCALDVDLKNGKILSTRPANGASLNRGQACVKGRFLSKDVVYAAERIKTPKIRKGKELEEVDWDEALDFVAKKLKAYKGSELALIDSPQMSSEDIYVSRKFAKEAIKTENVAVSPGFAPKSIYQSLFLDNGTLSPLNFKLKDIAEARTIVLMGTDLTVSHPIVWLEVLEAVKNGANLIVVSPTELASTRFAAQWLCNRAGSEIHLLGYLSKIILEQEETSELKEIEGYETFLKSLGQLSLERTVELTGINEHQLRATAQFLIEEGSVAYLFGTELTSLARKNIGVLALKNLALMTSGQLFPLGLENNLRGHFELTYFSSLRDKKIDDLLQSVEDGRIKALYVMGTLPWPKKARAEFVVFQGSYENETSQNADVVFPAATFAEVEGTYVNIEGRIQRFFPAIEPLGEARPDWWIFAQLAERLKLPGFKYKKSESILNEIQKNNFGLKKASAEDLKKGKEIFVQEREEEKSQFFPLEFLPSIPDVSNEYPFLLLNDYNLDAYRTLILSHVSRGMEKIRNPEWISICPEDAEKIGVENGDNVEIASELGKMTGRVRLTNNVAEGIVKSNFIWSENQKFHTTILKALGSDDFKSIRVLPVKIERG